MQLSSRTIWLVAASLADTARGLMVQSGERLVFDNGAYGNVTGFPNRAVFDPGSGDHQFPWRVQVGPITVKEVRLVVAESLIIATVVPNQNNNKPPESAIVNSTPGGLAASDVKLPAAPAPTGITDGDGGIVIGRDTDETGNSGVGSLPDGILTISITGDLGSVTVVDMDKVHALHPASSMHFQVLWETEASSGTTYSRVFTIATPDEANSVGAPEAYTNQQPYKPEEEGENGNSGPIGAVSTGTIPLTLPTSTPTTTVPRPMESTGSSTITNPTTSAFPTSSSLPQTSKATSSGLSTPQKIGLGVGVTLGSLLVLALLLFISVRRRRRQQQRSSPSDYQQPYAGHHTPDLISAKEANAGVHSVPHSPYTDDGQLAPRGTQMYGQHQGPSGHAPVMGVAGGSLRDETRDSTSVRGTEGAANGRTSRSGAVSHLVEEGMTEEEIRRLEEEERELDQAIERRGRL